MRCWPLFLVLFVGAAHSSGQESSLRRALETARSLAEVEITDEEELELGKAISQKIREVYGVEQNPEATRYVSLVGRVIAEKSSRPGLDYTFVILDSDSTNAFAAPGGQIHVTRGALALIRDESELAGVLAHELAHVSERHTLKALKKIKRVELVEDHSSTLQESELFEKLVDKATEIVLQAFGRYEEGEADREGMRVAAACGYDPYGLSRFLRSLQRRYADRELPAGLFASHPESNERIEKLRAQIRKENLDAGVTVRLADRFAHHLSYRSVALPQVGDAGPVSESGEEKGLADEGKEEAGLLSKLRNPFGSGKREEQVEVTGSAAARGIETELGMEEPGDPRLVPIWIFPTEIRLFKEEGRLH